jgi:UDP-2,4-diacetamido-2,4,6-trideoxy-beta-L-altropyranose hydrolase
MKKIESLVFRVDASIQMGTGHVMRCLALAQSWQDDGGEVYFCTHQDLPLALIQRLTTEGINRIELQFVPGSQADALGTISHCRNHLSSWLVLDGYHFDADYQQAIVAAGLQLLAIDDYGHADRYCADLVLNQNVYADAILYPRIDSHTQLLLGCEYALLRREFWQWRDDLQSKVRKLEPNAPLRLLVTLGGSDPNNTTFTVLTALKDLEGIEAKIIIGGSNPHLELLKSACDDLKDTISLYYDITNMPELMAESDLAIAAGGSTCWELAMMGIPSLLLILAENQRLNAEKLGELGVGINLGRDLQVTPKIISGEIDRLRQDPDRLTSMSEKAVTLVDGYGANRVIEYIKKNTR